MTTRSERVAALDEFMAAPKTVVMSDRQSDWRPSHIERELQQGWPLAINGEQLPDAALQIVGIPGDHHHFRIMIDYPIALCRLDHCDETHGNPAPLLDGVPPVVVGPHYHSWPINRRFFNQHERLVKLVNAVTYPGGGIAFDAVLRWFCDDTNIEALPPDHRIELPLRNTLL